MKKIILSLAILAGVSSAAQAQSARFGVKAGLNLSNASGDNTSNNKNLTGLAAGLMADFGFSDLISFHPELLYSQKGAKLEYNGLTAQDRINYLDIPLLLRVNADGLFFEAGPQAGILVGRKFESNVLPGSTSTNGVRKFDVGYVAGVGYQLSSGLELGVRYNGGILDINDPSTSGDKQRNSVFQFQLGYLFGGK